MSFFPFRYWSSSAPRRSTPTQTASTTSAPSLITESSQHVGQSSAAIPRQPSLSPPAITVTIASRSSSPSPTEHGMPDQSHLTDPPTSPPPSTSVQITINSPTNEPQTLSPLHETIPHLPSSLSSSLKTPSTPQMATQPPPPLLAIPGSPKRLASSNSPKHRPPTPPAKESRADIQEVSRSSAAPNKEGPQPAASQEGYQTTTEAKSDGDKAFKGQAMSVKQDLIETMSSISSQLSSTQKLASPPMKREHESDEKHEDIKEVKEVGQMTNTEAREAIKAEIHEFLDPNSSSEAQKAEIAKPDKAHINKLNDLGTKGILPASLLNEGSAKKRSTISGAQNKSTHPGRQHLPIQKAIRDDISNLVNRVAPRGLKSSVYEKPASVVDLSGENRGALMLLGSHPSKIKDPVHNHRGYENSPKESAEATSNGNGISEGKRAEDAQATEEQPEAYVNNNAQGINNSIVFSCFVTEQNPGVHIAVVSHISKESIQSTGKTSPTETRNE